jgi:ATP-binding cassette subfamily B protein
VTHDVAETRTFARVLVVEDGRIVEDGSPAELAARPDSRYAALLRVEDAAKAAWEQWKRLRLVDGRLEDTT